MFLRISLKTILILAAITGSLVTVSGCSPLQVINTHRDQKTTESVTRKTPISESASIPLFWSAAWQPGLVPAHLPSASASPAPSLKLGDSGASVTYLQEVLSYLGYLPVTFHARAVGSKTARTELARIPQVPLAGSFVWSDRAAEPVLGSLFSKNQFTVVTEGSVMQFQLNNHLSVDGIAGPKVYQKLTEDLMNNEASTRPYTFVTVSKASPETLTIWSGNKPVYRSLVNTGVEGAETPDGTWPVYLRYDSQTMSGTTPSGEHYSDPGIPYVSYFYGGCAIHGFVRASYGSPQSLGCVELPVSNARQVYPFTTLGTLVQVQSS